MISFKSYLKDYGKKYIALRLSEASQKSMMVWCKANGFDNSRNFNREKIDPSDFDFHITVFYSDNKKYVKSGHFAVEPIKLDLKKIELLGKEKNIPTILIDSSPELSNIRKVYEAAGLTDPWPAWKPHLTISYVFTGTPVLAKVKLPDFTITVDQIIISNQGK